MRQTNRRNHNGNRNSNDKPNFRQRTAGQTRPSSRGKQVSTIDPRKLEKTAVKTAVAAPYKSSRTFADFPLNERLHAAIKRKGYSSPTEIQDKTLEHVLAGCDVIGVARTGTGKTCSFLIPMINRWLTSNGRTPALVLVPTRELAVQVETEFKSLVQGFGMYSVCLIGGTSVESDINRLRKFSHLIVATPGRLTDLMDRRALDLSVFSTLVIDEFDRMLDMGFSQDVMQIASVMRNRTQTLLFSATVDQSQKTLISRLVKNPVEVKVSSGDTASDSVEQNVIRLKPDEKKFDKLYQMLSQKDFEKVLVFAETKRLVSKLCVMLKQSGIASEEIHGNKSQGYRQRALTKFTAGKVKVLVATDVAARGLDIANVTHVINYQLPMNYDSYIHRIGRTGRAGKTGIAYTFVD